MINITDEAKKELKKMLSENAPEPGILLRLASNEEGQLGLIMDKEEAGDRVVEYEGTKIMVVDGHFASQLEGISLEVEETPEGPSLILTGSSCGCCGEHEGDNDEPGCGGSCCSDKPC